MTAKTTPTPETPDQNATKTALHKTNNLAAIALGIAGASILFSAGTAFATSGEHKGPEGHEGKGSHSQESNMTQEQKQMHESMEAEHENMGKQGGKHMNGNSETAEGTQMHERDRDGMKAGSPMQSNTAEGTSN